MPQCNATPSPPTSRAGITRFVGVALVVNLALFVLSVPTTHALQPVLVTDLEAAATPGPQALTIALSRQPDTVRAFTLKEPARLVLDLSPARLAGEARRLPSGHGLIHGIRAAQNDPRTVRVVFDLRADVTHRVESLPPGVGGADHGLVVSLFPASLATGPDNVPLAATSTQNSFPPDASASPAQAPTATDKTILLFGQTGPEKRPAATPSPWGILDFSGLLVTKGAQELREDRYPEQARSIRGAVRVETKWTPPGPANAAQGSSGTFLLASVQADYLGFGPAPSSDDGDLDLFETYLHHATPGWDLRLGRQIVRWGKTDQISPVDNLNPQDMREFFIPDLEERKIPNWMARTRLFADNAGPLGAIALEGVLVPVFRANEFDWTGTTWALLGVKNPGLRMDEDTPGGLDHADYGLRAAATLAAWDLAVSWLQATEKNPRLRLDPFHPQGPTLRADYGRQNIFGFEFETTLDTFGLRGEGAYFDRQSFNTRGFDPTSSPVSHWVLGLDYIGQSDWYMNIQLSHQHIFDHDEDILFLRRDNFYLNGEINREFLRGDLTLKLVLAVDLRDGGAFVTPEAIWKAVENLELSLGLNCFFGPRDSVFGRYRDNDQTFLRATWHF